MYLAWVGSKTHNKFAKIATFVRGTRLSTRPLAWRYIYLSRLNVK